MRVTLAMLCVCICGFAAIPASAHSAAPAKRPLIIPEPQYLQWRSGAGFRVNAATKVVVNDGADQRDLFAANQLRRKVWDTTGFLPRIVRGGNGAPTRNVIAIGRTGSNSAVAAILRLWPGARGKSPKSEGYVLGVGNNSIVISGFDQKGTFYGCQTLIQLLEHYRKGSISSLFCYDYPDLAVRGVALGFWGDFDLDFAKEIISEVLARNKMNWLTVYISESNEMESHPELRRLERIPSRAKVAAFIEYAKRYFTNVVPASGDWCGGYGWMAYKGLNEDLLENPEDRNPILCFRNPNARKLVDDVRDECIRMFGSKYFMITGMSETSAIVSQSCPLCKGKDPVETFQEIMKYDADFFASRGIRPMMWSDMIRSDMPAGKRHGTDKCVTTMPKNMIIMDWDYSTKTDFTNLKTWKDNGLDFIAVPYGFGEYNYVGKENIYYYAMSAKKYGAMGVVQYNKAAWAFKEPMLNNRIRMIDLGTLPYVAEWSWSVGKPDWKPAPYDGQQIIRERISPDKPYWLKASRNRNSVVLTWTNPPDKKLVGTLIRYRTDKYPVDPTDGTLLCDISGKPNAEQEFIQMRGPRGKVYYSAFSHDGIRRFSAAAHAVSEVE